MSKVVELLNELLKSDPEAIHRLILHRVECEQATADRLPLFVKTTCDDSTVDEHGNPVPVHSIGIIGLLNGILKELDLNLVAGRYGEDRRSVLGFSEVLRSDEQTGNVEMKPEPTEE